VKDRAVAAAYAGIGVVLLAGIVNVAALRGRILPPYRETAIASAQIGLYLVLGLATRSTA
jgi:hypothetical protein